MMSKNSFWVSMKENNKRRIWLWIISSLFWFFYYPVCTAMLMSRKQEHNRIDGLVGAAARERLTDAAYQWLTFNQVRTVSIIVVIAIVCAIQGFSYLYSRKKVDMYHSVPVKKFHRFSVIYLNGVLICFVPYVLNLLLAILIAWAGGGMNGYNFIMAMLAMGLSLLLYLGIYGLTLIAVMLTGNFVITVFATVIFLSYEPLLKMLTEEYQRTFFSSFSSYSVNDRIYLSPIARIGEVMEAIDISEQGAGAVLQSVIPSLLAAILMAVVFTAIAYFCYLKRPAEAAGKAMAFERTKAVVKLFLTVPFSLGMVLVVDDIVGSNDGFLIFTMIAAVVLSNCIIEVIYEADIRAAFRKKYQILISGLCVAAIVCVFGFDLIGYDAWTPSPEKLESASFLFYDFKRWNNYIGGNMESYADYALSMPGVTDIEAICELSENRAEGEEAVVWFDVAYRMKNGKVVWRNFAVSQEQEKLLNRIIGSEEYKKMAYQLYNDDSFENFQKYKVDEITFNSGFRMDNLPIEDLAAFREAWKKDMRNLSYTELRDEFACGDICIDFSVDRSRSSWIRYNIYPSFTNVLAYLEKRGIDAEESLRAEDIASIVVTNQHSEERDKLYRQQMESVGEAEASLYMNSVDTSVTKIYTEKEKIEELLPALYHESLSTAWKRPDALNEDYYVNVRYKDGRADSAVYRTSPNAYLITDRIPDWLERETAYK